MAQLGLYPFPKEKLPLEEILGAKLVGRIAEIVAQNPAVRGPLVLIDIVYNQMKAELYVPTAEGHKLLRYMVARWVTTNCMGTAAGTWR